MHGRTGVEYVVDEPLGFVWATYNLMSHSAVEVVCLPKAYRRYKTKHLKPTETHTHVTRDPPWAIHSDTSGSVGVWRTKGEGYLFNPLVSITLRRRAHADL
ncbi:hypothetical protein CDAR_107101 [Caerostris darwini]|uniref:Uncharacterized protein n=1 Tax=Caerostris darwini TaxID=1538125 RepID=A0AAV4SYR5_9ARAC|nr:hypothetical protein CDAR_107101 [Caerostris darwini]